MIHREAPALRTHAARGAYDGPPSVYDHEVGARVLTMDGHLGTVEAVNGGPFPGTEAYRVTLDDGMGGGDYLPGQIQAAPPRLSGTAAADYPELADVVTRYPDPGRGR